MKRWSIGGILGLLVMGCRSGGGPPYGGYPPPPPPPPFQITVVDPAGKLLPDVRVMDYNPPFSPPLPASAQLTPANNMTDSRGIAQVDGWLRDRTAVIGKTNYLPLSVASLQPATYTLQPAARKLVAIGAVAGQPVLFAANYVVTVASSSGSRSGVLNTYQFTDSSVTLVKATLIPGSTGGAPRFWRMIGDQFWYSTPSDGIYVYSLANPTSPVQQLYLPVPGDSVLFAVRGNLLVTTDWPYGGPDGPPLKAYVFTPAGQVGEVSRYGDFSATDLQFFGDNLVVVGGGDPSTPAISVVNYTDPSRPALRNTGTYPRSSEVFLLGSQLVLSPTSQNARPFSYGLEDVTDPEYPVDLARFNSDGWVTSFLSPTAALSGRGTYDRVFQILSGSTTGGFQISGVFVPSPANSSDSDSVGGADPYYVLGGTLWKLVPP